MPLKLDGTKIIKFIRDITDSKRAEEKIRESELNLRDTQAELAKMTHAMTVSQLTASIAHEVNQPLSGIITNAGTCLRMLDADPPNIEGARETARRTIRDGNRGFRSHNTTESFVQQAASDDRASGPQRSNQRSSCAGVEQAPE